MPRGLRAPEMSVDEARAEFFQHGATLEELTPERLTTTYRIIALKCHPDFIRNDQALKQRCTHLMIRLNAAKAALSQPNMVQAYQDRETKSDGIYTYSVAQVTAAILGAYSLGYHKVIVRHPKPDTSDAYLLANQLGAALRSRTLDSAQDTLTMVKSVISDSLMEAGSSSAWFSAIRHASDHSMYGLALTSFAVIWKIPDNAHNFDPEMQWHAVTIEKVNTKVKNTTTGTWSHVLLADHLLTQGYTRTAAGVFIASTQKRIMLKTRAVRLEYRDKYNVWKHHVLDANMHYGQLTDAVVTQISAWGKK